MDKRKLIGTIIGVLAFLALIIGVTYAYLYWSASVNVEGDVKSCFNVTYTGNGFNEDALTMSSDYTGGLMASATVSYVKSCSDINVTGSIKLNTNSFKVGNTSMLTAGALKYQVLIDDVAPQSGGSGTVSLGDNIIVDNLSLPLNNLEEHTYKVYLWLDGEIADATYIGAVYDGYIHAEFIQN